MRVRREYERKNPPNCHMHDMDKECMTAVTIIHKWNGPTPGAVYEWSISNLRDKCDNSRYGGKIIQS